MTALYWWLAVSSGCSVVFLLLVAQEERAQARVNRALRQGRVTMRAGGVIQRRHPSECADCQDVRRYEDGRCWTCGGRNRQPRAIHREAAA